MSFASQLQAAKGDLTARQVAAAVSPLLSVRTVEDWLADRRSPPAWTHDWIISRVRVPRGDCAPEFSKIKFPKRPRKQKGQNPKLTDAVRSSGKFGLTPAK